MLGCYDFCGHYEWTFAWLRQAGGEDLVHEYWDQAIHRDSQRHARDLILAKGIDGMKEYWGHVLVEEAAGFTTEAGDHFFRVDIQQCPSKGFLMDNCLEQYPDYCDHCIGWIGPMMKEAGFIVHHQHNHRGNCWWEFRREGSGESPSGAGALAGSSDVRLLPGWEGIKTPVDTFISASSARDKQA